jgi:hypothetical protein
MTNATFMEIANKRNAFILIIAIFMLVKNCIACCCTDEGSMSDSSIFANIEKRKPIANYCLNIKSVDDYSLKFESIIDSSVFAKMEEHNCQWCDQEEILNKKYFVKIKDRNNMTCSGEYIKKDYCFLFKNFSLSTWGYDTRSFSVKGGHTDCFESSSKGMRWVPCHSSSSGESSSSSSVFPRPYPPGKALTEIPIDFPEKTAEVIIDTSIFNELKSYIGKTIPVSWKFKIVCPPHSDTTIIGSYFVRITGECGKK